MVEVNKTEDEEFKKYIFKSSTGIDTCIFHAAALERYLYEVPWKTVNLSYKLLNVDSRLLSTLLENHGFREVSSNSNDFNLMWSNNLVKTEIISSLKSFQRVNHFPRSCELTRKDKLYKNIEKMSHQNGIKNFSFIPETYIMPKDYNNFIINQYKHRGLWIVKPFDLSRGRGITIIDYPFNEVQRQCLKENVVVLKYVDNPLLVNGYKWDLRLYVLVTSFNPLIIYLYEEGLARFATVKYDYERKNVNNKQMHLCNYSINKHSPNYIKNSDPKKENVGHKWSMSALLNYLRKNYLIDTKTLMSEIEDIVIKTIISGAAQMLPAINCFVPHSQNCFELYGFDILVDDKLKPWLIEVNLSPSLGIDSTLDSKIKSSMLCDLFTLIGIPIIDPTIFDHSNKFVTSMRRPKSSILKKNLSHNNNLKYDEKRLLLHTIDQNRRSRGFIRIYPTKVTCKKYTPYLDNIYGVPRGSTLPPFYVKLMKNYNCLLSLTLFSEHTSFDLSVDRQDRYERSLRDCNYHIDNKNNNVNNECDVIELKNAVFTYLKNGFLISKNQIRQIFVRYLIYISENLKRFTMEKDSQPSTEFTWLLFLKISKKLNVPLKTKSSNYIWSKNQNVLEVIRLMEILILKYNNYKPEMFNDIKNPQDYVPQKLMNLFLSYAKKEDIEDLIEFHHV
ncbi:tubulin polyglutamylase TTLL5 [Daktulosphaira vitifoliae]|uniref:tubulin polyglutamylase TTLL5 n=1 Tax=Daktulosphaira vitifoliae TaxID=58002 RepID=UPI0021AAB6B8|nr:tubulin polyglutamylase TTLL5 [Daktulosphaira vitifoliae]